MASEFLVSKGYGRSLDYVDLMANGYGVIDGSWQMPSLDPSTGLWQTAVDVVCMADTPNGAVLLVRQLQTKLNQARKAAGRFGAGTICTFGVRLDTDEWVYLPFARHPDTGECGFITGMSRGNGNRVHTLTLTMFTEPLALGDLLSLSISGTITIGDGAPGAPGSGGAGGMLIADWPGDLDSPCTIKVIDQSTSSKVINAMLFGRKSRDVLSDTDFDFVLNAVKSGGTATQTTATGTAVNDEFSRITTTGDWQEMATISGPSPMAANRGPVDIMLRVRDAQMLLSPTALVASRTSNGSWATGHTYTFRVTGLNGGVESGPSNQSSVTITSTSVDKINLNWTVGGAPTDHRVYWSSDGGVTFQHVDTGSALGTFAMSAEPSGTAGSPPTSGTISQAVLRLRSGLASLLKTDQQPAWPTTVANSIWHLMPSGQHYLSGMLAIEDYDDPPWAYIVDGKGVDLLGINLDVDAAIHFPADEPQLTVSYPDMDLTAQREWIASTRYDRGTSCLLRSKSDQSEKGRADVDGYMMLAPGDQILLWQALIAGGEHDLQHTAATFEVSGRPAYAYLRGT